MMKVEDMVHDAGVNSYDILCIYKESIFKAVQVSSCVQHRSSIVEMKSLSLKHTSV